MGLEAIDQRLVEAIQILDSRGLPYAEIRRALRLPTPYELERLREARQYSELVRTLVP